MSGMREPSVEIKGLGKRFVIGPPVTMGEQLNRAARKLMGKPPAPGPTRHEFWAIRNIDLTIHPGEVVGIIGRNGAGKSTLLKILARIQHPTEGSALIRGRLGSLLEVGTGFSRDQTGRENVYMNGTILGLSRTEIRNRFEEIVDFAEVREFIDTPIKHYSSGMTMRLAFAVAAHLMPEVLLLDEVLAVGDAAFQRKCLDKMDQVARSGRTILFVSHAMPAVRSLCTRAILLEQGTMTMDGPTEDVAGHYLGLKQQAKKLDVSLDEDPGLRLQIMRARLLPPMRGEGEEETLPLEVTYTVRKPMHDVMLCIDVRDAKDISVYYANDDEFRDPRRRAMGTHTVICEIPKHLLKPGDYRVLFGFWQPGHPPEHFPHEHLTFHRPEPLSRLSSHQIPWPSYICKRAEWSYVEDPEPLAQNGDGTVAEDESEAALAEQHP